MEVTYFTAFTYYASLKFFLNWAYELCIFKVTLPSSGLTRELVSNSEQWIRKCHKFSRVDTSYSHESRRNQLTKKPEVENLMRLSFVKRATRWACTRPWRTSRSSTWANARPLTPSSTEVGSSTASPATGRPMLPDG